jgi:hypothetical protein
MVFFPRAAWGSLFGASTAFFTACGSSESRAVGGPDAAGADVQQPTTGADGGTDSGDAGTGDAAPGDGDAGAVEGALDPNLPPGSNFDLVVWYLQEPSGSAGSPTYISSAMLQAGYHDAYFYTDPTDGAMTFFDPENGIVIPGSTYPRSELREVNTDGSNANWPVAGTNRLAATVAVVDVPDHVCVGQIHIGSPLGDAGLADSTLPLLELYYHVNGEIDVGIENMPVSGNESYTTLATVPLGTRFDYVISLTGDGTGNGTIGITINGTQQTFPMPSGFVGYGEYFKAGDYDQSVSDAGVAATVKFYALSVIHTQ